MALARAFTWVGVLSVSLAALAGTGEVVLRLLPLPPDPVGFQRRNDPAGWDADGLGRVPVVFDPRLLWRTADGAGAAAPKDERELLVLADGSACDPRRGTPWPARLARLLDLNEAERPIRVVTLAAPGYSSFQGRRRLEAHPGRPVLVLVGLGANDASRVRVPDPEHARRLAGLGSLGRSWLAVHVAHRLWSFTGGGRSAPRVAPEETRANLEAIAARVRGWGGDVVLLDSPGQPAASAVPVLELLAERGLVLTRHRHPAQADLGRGDGWPELERGFGPLETGPQGLPGRWAAADAALRLERRSGEAGLALEVSCPQPAEATIHVNGAEIGGLGGCLGRRWYRFSVEAVPDDGLQVRLATPRARQVFVHGVWLTRSAEPAARAADPLYAAELALEHAGDERPELGPGWHARESWTDGRRGRWTAREASLYLERTGPAKGLLLDATLENPDGVTSCRVEVNGVPVYAFSSPNGRHHYGVDIEHVRGRRLHVRLVVQRTFVPGDGDDRALGLFVHGVRLARSPMP